MRVQVQFEVEADDAAVERHEVGVEVGQPHPLVARRLVVEQHLEDGADGGVAVRLEVDDELLEGHVLVGEGAEHGVLAAPHGLAQGGRPGQVGADHQGVDEEADQALQLLVGLAGDRHAEEDVLLAAVTAHQGGEAGQQDGEGGGPLLQGEGVHGPRQVLGELELLVAAVDPVAGGPGAVHRQLEDAGGAFEALAPVRGELPLALAGEPAALPDRVVDVLLREFGQRGGRALRQLAVEGVEFAEERAHGPAVADDVVDAERDQVLVVGDPDGRGAQEGAGREVEGLRRPLLDALLGGGRGVGGGGGVELLDHRLEGRPDLLDGHAVGRGEDGPEDLVAAHDPGEGARQGPAVGGGGGAQHDGDVVRAAAGDEPVEDPQPPLGEGDGPRPGLLVVAALAVALGEQPGEPAPLLFQGIGRYLVGHGPTRLPRRHQSGRSNAREQQRVNKQR
ncbi:hypothetical protein [Streptomyces sp. SID5770]|uniref:hypothetical protein n=1 Tax=Streptomyces sp. SID5770 TaxID=2690308 RepID=UPI001F1BA261|nr:hypothetical protein [Streptomyces sp. SID5770]